MKEAIPSYEDSNESASATAPNHETEDVVYIAFCFAVTEPKDEEAQNYF